MNGSIEDLENGYNIWIDISDQHTDNINDLASKFNLNTDAVDTCLNKIQETRNSSVRKSYIYRYAGNEK